MDRYLPIMIIVLMLTACEDKQAVSINPDCQVAVNQVLQQEKNKPESYFKRPIQIEQLSIFQQSEGLLLCRGIATLSDKTQIPVHIQAKQYKQKWNYQLIRGSSIK